MHIDYLLFIKQLIFLYFIALGCGFLARKFKMPALIGEITGGFIIGLSCFGHYAPAINHWLLDANKDTETLRSNIVYICLVLYMFAIGAELKLDDIKSQSRYIFAAVLGGDILPFVLGMVIVLIFPQCFQIGLYNGWIISLFVGTALSISAIPVIARILKDVQMLHTDIGCIIIGSAVIDDIIGWTLLSALLSYTQTRNILTTICVTLFVLVFYIFIYVIRKLYDKYSKFSSSRILQGVLIVIVVMLIIFAKLLGIDTALVAFLVGVLIGNIKLTNDNAVEKIAASAAPLYFLSIGWYIDITKSWMPVMILIITLAACIGKILGVSGILKLSGLDGKKAFMSGIGLNARGAMGIVFAGLGLSHNLISSSLYISIIIMSLITTLISALIMQRMCMRTQGCDNPTGVCK